MSLDDGTGDGEAEAATLAAFVQADKAFEEARQVFGRIGRPLLATVTRASPSLAATVRRTQPPAGVAQGVGEQVADGPLEACPGRRRRPPLAVLVSAAPRPGRHNIRPTADRGRGGFISQGGTARPWSALARKACQQSCGPGRRTAPGWTPRSRYSSTLRGRDKETSVCIRRLWMGCATRGRGRRKIRKGGRRIPPAGASMALKAATRGEFDRHRHFGQAFAQAAGGNAPRRPGHGPYRVHAVAGDGNADQGGKYGSDHDGEPEITLHAVEKRGVVGHVAGHHDPGGDALTRRRRAGDGAA